MHMVSEGLEVVLGSVVGLVDSRTSVKHSAEGGEVHKEICSNNCLARTQAQVVVPEPMQMSEALISSRLSA